MRRIESLRLIIEERTFLDRFEYEILECIRACKKAKSENNLIYAEISKQEASYIKGGETSFYDRFYYLVRDIVKLKIFNKEVLNIKKGMNKIG